LREKVRSAGKEKSSPLGQRLTGREAEKKGKAFGFPYREKRED